jgi:hypothetical protein
MPAIMPPIFLLLIAAPEGGDIIHATLARAHWSPYCFTHITHWFQHASPRILRLPLYSLLLLTLMSLAIPAPRQITPLRPYFRQTLPTRGRTAVVIIWIRSLGTILDVDDFRSSHFTIFAFFIMLAYIAPSRR